MKAKKQTRVHQSAESFLKLWETEMVAGESVKKNPLEVEVEGNKWSNRTGFLMEKEIKPGLQFFQRSQAEETKYANSRFSED